MNHGVTAIIARNNEKQEKEYLLIRSNTNVGEYTGKFYPPSGWMEKGEKETEAVIRELHKPISKFI